MEKKTEITIIHKEGELNNLLVLAAPWIELFLPVLGKNELTIVIFSESETRILQLLVALMNCGLMVERITCIADWEDSSGAQPWINFCKHCKQITETHFDNEGRNECLECGKIK